MLHSRVLRSHSTDHRMLRDKVGVGRRGRSGENERTISKGPDGTQFRRNRGTETFSSHQSLVELRRLGGEGLNQYTWHKSEPRLIKDETREFRSLWGWSRPGDRSRTGSGQMSDSSEGTRAKIILALSGFRRKVRKRIDLDSGLFTPCSGPDRSNKNGRDQYLSGSMERGLVFPQYRKEGKEDGDFQYKDNWKSSLMASLPPRYSRDHAMYHWEDKKGWESNSGIDKNRIDQETRDRMEENMRSMEEDELETLFLGKQKNDVNPGKEENINWSLRKPGDPESNVRQDPDTDKQESLEHLEQTEPRSRENISDRDLRSLLDGEGFSSSLRLRPEQWKTSLTSSRSMDNHSEIKTQSTKRRPQRTFALSTLERQITERSRKKRLSIQDEEDRFSFSGVDENREEDEDTIVHGVNMRRGSRDHISSRRRNKSCVEIRDLSSSRSERFSSLDTRTSRVSSLDTRASRSSSQGTRSKRVSSQGLRTSRDDYQDVRTSRSGSNDARMDTERVREKTGEEKCTCIGKQNNYRRKQLGQKNISTPHQCGTGRGEGQDEQGEYLFDERTSRPQSEGRVSTQRLNRIATSHHLPRYVHNRGSPLRAILLSHESSHQLQNKSGESQEFQRKNEKLKSRRTTITGDWTELQKIAQKTYSSGFTNQYRKHNDNQGRERGSVENFLPLLLQTVSPLKSMSHSPSDPGICMDSGGEDLGSDPQELNRCSDSAHSSPFSSSSSSSSSFSSCSSPNSSSEPGKEEAVSMAYIDESKTMHSYIASRGQRECELDIYEVRPPCLRVTKKIVEVVRV